MGVLCLLWAFEPSDHTLADVLFAVGCFEEAVLCLIDGAVFQQDAEIGAAVNHALQEITAQLVAEKDVVDLGKAKAQEQQLLNTIYATFSIAVWYLVHNKLLFSSRKVYVKDLKRRVPILRFARNVKQTLVAAMFNFVPYIYLRILFLLYKSK